MGDIGRVRYQLQITTCKCAPFRIVVDKIVPGNCSCAPPKRLTPAQRSFLIAVDEVVRRGFSKHGGPRIEPRRPHRGRPTKRERQERASRLAAQSPSLGWLAEGSVQAIRDQLAIDWNGTPAAVSQIFGRWGVTAESHVRAILEHNGALKLEHLANALAPFNGRKAAQRSAVLWQRTHVIRWNIRSVLRAHRRLPKHGKHTETDQSW